MNKISRYCGLFLIVFGISLNAMEHYPQQLNTARHAQVQSENGRQELLRTLFIMHQEQVHRNRVVFAFKRTGIFMLAAGLPTIGFAVYKALISSR